MLKFNSFKELDEKLDFSRKAGFQLSPQQTASIESLAVWPRSGNFSEVGTGKTVMSTATSYMKGKTVTIVTVPPILIPQWEIWLKQFTPKVVRYQGSPRYRTKLVLADARWIIMSHAIFRQDFNRLYDDLHLKDGLEIIVDEAQSLKNPASVLYKCVVKMGNGHDIQLLTGTPTNKPLDSYSYIKIKTPEVYRSLGHFENVHVAERDFFKQPTKYQNLDLLAKNLALQTVKHTKQEMFGYDLTPIYTPMPYDLDPEHAKLYEKLVDEQLLLLGDGTKIDATTAQKLYHALQQIVCNWSHFAGEQRRSAIYDLLDSVVEQTDVLNPARSKLIVWTYYKMTSRNMLAYCHEQWPGTTVAAYSEVDSAASVKRFLEDPNCRILVAQPTSAGVGLNPAHLCSEMLFAEASTVPSHMRQSIGRVDRMGQKVRPTIRFASATGTIQGYLYRRLSENDDLVVKVENLRDNIRSALRGQT